jgi:hypothetical protein
MWDMRVETNAHRFFERTSVLLDLAGAVLPGLALVGVDFATAAFFAGGGLDDGSSSSSEIRAFVLRFAGLGVKEEVAAVVDVEPRAAGGWVGGADLPLGLCKSQKQYILRWS